MIDNFLTVASQVIMLFVMIAVGYGCGKMNLLNDEKVKGLTDLMLYIVTPCVIVHSFQRELEKELLIGLGITCIIAIVVHVVNILIAHCLIRTKQKEREAVYRFASVFSNCGYMAFPLLNAVLGSVGVFYGAAYIAVFNVVLWTYGLLLMSGDKSQITVKKLISNPGLTSVFVGLILFLCSIHLPAVIGTPIESLAALNSPVAMLIIGFCFTKCRFTEVLKDMKVYCSMGIRLVLVPAMALLLMFVLGLHETNHVLMVACVISSSAPAAAATTMFATKYNKDAALASGLVSYMTLCSIITMPLFVALAQSL